MRKRTVAALAALSTAVVGAVVFVGTAHAASGAPDPTTCQLDPASQAIKHVIYLQFDNVHLTRDNPNVPSDLEQMPHLLNFLTSNGTMDANHHTPVSDVRMSVPVCAINGVW